MRPTGQTLVSDKLLFSGVGAVSTTASENDNSDIATSYRCLNVVEYFYSEI